MSTARDGEQRNERFTSLILEINSAANDQPARIETTRPYPGLTALDTEKTEATSVPIHILAAARASARAEAKQKRRVQLHKWIVSAYRVVGFAILTVIVLGMVSYIGTSVFYLVSSSWVTPAVISPTDDHVLQLKARLAEQASQRDKLVSERALIAASLADVERIIASNERFCESFHQAVSADVVDRRAQLNKLRALAQELGVAKQEIGDSNRAYAGLSRQRNDELKKAKILDEEGYLAGNYQLSQMAHANLQLAEKSVEIDTRTSELAREADALAAIDGKGGGAALSYDALRLRQEYQRASLELDKARDTKRALAESLAATDRSIARYDHILSAINEAPLLVAAEGKVTVVLVPYENLAAVKQGAALYACALGFVACHKAGSVVNVLAGEMEVRHPFHAARALRGQAVQVQLSDARAATDAVLFVGRAPLFL